MTHPAVQDAISACEQLAEAAGKIGAPDPISAIQHIDCDPQQIDAYGDALDKSVQEIDKSIAEAKQAQDQHGESSDGDGSEAGQAASEQELADLKHERDQLAGLAAQVHQLSADMDNAVRSASDVIKQIAGDAEPAVAKVLDRAWWEKYKDQVLGDDEAEQVADRVNDAVSKVIKQAQAYQDEIGELRTKFQELKKVESEAGRTDSGAEGPAGGTGDDEGGAEGGVGHDGAEAGAGGRGAEGGTGGK